MRILGMSSCCKNDVGIDTLEEYRSNHIDAMEVSITRNSEYENIDYNKIRKNADLTGIMLWSWHLPFGPFEENNIASKDRSIREKTIRFQSEIIKKASDIGIKTMVIHPSGEPNCEEDRPLLMNYAKECIKRLSEVCTESGSVLAVEDLPRTCLGRNSQEIKELISVDDSVGVCFDTNHLLGESIKDFMENVGDKIRTVHISDYDFTDERHWLPGEGKIDWVEFMDLLDKYNYQNPFMYEIPFKAPDTIKREHMLTFSDFYRNYKELHERKKLTVFGKATI